MRVLIANNFYAPDVVGGAELSVQGIAEGLARLGHDVAVLATGLNDQTDELNDVTIYRRRFNALMPYKVHLESPVSPKKLINKALAIYNPRNDRVIREVLSQQRTDVVLTNNLLGITVQIWRTARRMGVPVMHTLRDYALLCPNSVLMCRTHPECVDHPKSVCAAMRMVLRRASQRVDVVSAPSRYTLNAHLQRGYFETSHTCVIRNAVAYEESTLRAVMQHRRSMRCTGPLRIVYLGRLIAEKGVEVLLDALQMFEPGTIEAHFAGSGPLQDSLASLQNDGLPIYAHGFLSQSEVHNLLLGCDVLVAPSLCAESFGRIVLDAYTHAMPAVVSNAGGLPEVLAPGTGAVVDAGDALQLHDAIEKYVQDRGKVITEGIAAALQAKNYTVDAQVRSFERELENLYAS